MANSSGSRPYHGNTEPVTNPAEQLKLALWLIGKCGSPQEALIAVQAAVTALETFERVKADMKKEKRHVG